MVSGNLFSGEKIMEGYCCFKQKPGTSLGVSAMDRSFSSLHLRWSSSLQVWGISWSACGSVPNKTVLLDKRKIFICTIVHLLPRRTVSLEVTL
jgi:hypothetical protein